jgi:hypothetical protein
MEDDYAPSVQSQGPSVRTISTKQTSSPALAKAPRSTAAEHVTSIKHVAAVKVAPPIAPKAKAPVADAFVAAPPTVVRPAAGLSSLDIDQFFADVAIQDTPFSDADSHYSPMPHEHDYADHNATPAYPPKPYAPLSYASAAKLNVQTVEEVEIAPIEATDGELLCPFYYNGGECPNPDSCTYVHGEQCAICLMFCITDSNRVFHEAECLEGVEENARLDDLRGQSADIECGICYERVLENKNPTERRYAFPSCFSNLIDNVQLWYPSIVQPCFLSALHPQLAPPRDITFSDCPQVPPLPSRVAFCGAL